MIYRGPGFLYRGFGSSLNPSPASPISKLSDSQSSLESIPWLLKRLQIGAQIYKNCLLLLAKLPTLLRPMNMICFHNRTSHGSETRLKTYLSIGLRGGRMTMGPNFFRSPGTYSKESIPPAYVAWRAGTTTLFLLGS